MAPLAEVARHAGVSANTVSYVLSAKRSVSATTRQRVEQSIRELGHHPNAGARALTGSRSHIIAAATTARTHGYDALLLTGEERTDAVRRVTGSGLADGMILMDVGLEDQRLRPAAGHRPAGRPRRTARRHHGPDLPRPRLHDGRAVRRASGGPGAPRRRRHRRGPGRLRAAHRFRRVHPSTDSDPAPGRRARACCTGPARAGTPRRPSPWPGSSTSARTPRGSWCRTSRRSSRCPPCCASRAPAGARWTDAWTGETYEGGTAVTVDARWSGSRCFCGTGRGCPWRGEGGRGRSGPRRPGRACVWPWCPPGLRLRHRSDGGGR